MTQTSETQTAAEVAQKLEQIRAALAETGAAGVRLRGSDWFAWATAGGSNTVLLTAETGVAEVLVTTEGAWVLTDAIEAQRLQAEELLALGDSYQLFVHPWVQGSDRESFVEKVTAGGLVLSDRPTGAELPLPPTLVNHKRTLLPAELERYRRVGRLASEAMTEALSQAQPNWSEYQLAAAGAAALWSRGLHPALTLAAGERRLPLYRHPTATSEVIGPRAMLVFCARGYGLYANLTRFVAFEPLLDEEKALHRQIAEIEAVALNASQVEASLDQVYSALAHAYDQQGYPTAIEAHHQGGTTGYLAREVVATPASRERLSANMVLAWNPSLAGAKIEDTFVRHADELENLTFDPNFPHLEINGRLRPIPWER